MNHASDKLSETIMAADTSHGTISAGSSDGTSMISHNTPAYETVAEETVANTQIDAEYTQHTQSESEHGQHIQSESEYAWNTPDPHKVSPKPDVLLENFSIFGVASILYGIFFTFCLYKNYAGITLPFFALATIVYYAFCMKKLGRIIRKDSVFYAACIIILSLATIFTDNSLFIFFNHAGMLLLLVTCLILNFYENTDFSFGNYLSAILNVLIGSIGYISYPFSSFHKFLSRRRRGNGKGRYVWYGILIAIPLLFVVMALLMSADVVFRNLFGELFEKIVIPSNLIGILFMTALGILGSYMILANLASGHTAGSGANKRAHEPLVAITFTSVLTVIYLLFCFIQIFYLFLGNLKLPDGYTYAKYAREGFFQLLFVCILNLLIVLVCIDHFREHTALKAILSVFCACTFIMIASSAMRMILYIQAYHLSIDRVLVLWALFVITLLMALVCINIFKKDFPLFRLGVIVVTICYILLSVSRPDTYIARYNIEAELSGSKTLGRLDTSYLFYELSADAAPVLDAYGLLVPVKGHVDQNGVANVMKNNSAANDTLFLYDAYTLYYYYGDFKEWGENAGIREFNISRYRALKLSQKYDSVIDYSAH